MLPNDVSQETRSAHQRESAGKERCLSLSYVRIVTRLRDLGFISPNLTTEVLLLCSRY